MNHVHRTRELWSRMKKNRIKCFVVKKKTIKCFINHVHWTRELWSSNKFLFSIFFVIIFSGNDMHRTRKLWARNHLPQCQKRPTTVSKETYYNVKRDLLQCPKNIYYDFLRKWHASNLKALGTSSPASPSISGTWKKKYYYNITIFLSSESFGHVITGLPFHKWYLKKKILL